MLGGTTTVEKSTQAFVIAHRAIYCRFPFLGTQRDVVIWSHIGRIQTFSGRHGVTSRRRHLPDRENRRFYPQPWGNRERAGYGFCFAIKSAIALANESPSRTKNAPLPR